MYKATRLRKRGRVEGPKQLAVVLLPHRSFLFHAVTLTVEIALVLVRLNQITRCIVDANHHIM